jgi:hypothetical protein
MGGGTGKGYTLDKASHIIRSKHGPLKGSLPEKPSLIADNSTEQ